MPRLFAAHSNKSHRVPTRALATLMIASAGVISCGSSADPRPASWSYVSAAILTPNCATVSCHSRAAAVSGIDFSSPDHGYLSLTGLWNWIVDPRKMPSEATGCRQQDGTILCQSNNRGLVVPCNPAQSRLIQMLRGSGNAPRMPPDRPLSDGDIKLIERWIANGALETGPAPDAGVTKSVCLAGVGGAGGNGGSGVAGSSAGGEGGAPGSAGSGGGGAGGEPFDAGADGGAMDAGDGGSKDGSVDVSAGAG